MSDDTDIYAPYEVPDDYDPAREWAKWGKRYADTFDPEPYAMQEMVIERVLRSIEFDSVLDIGCGFGRLGLLARRVNPACSYTGIDVSPDQIRGVLQRIPDAETYVTAILDWEPGERQWDLVLSAEVLMHQTDDVIVPTVQRMLGWARGWMVTVDWWDPANAWQTNSWNRLHPFPSLYGDRLEVAERINSQVLWKVRGTPADSQGENA